MFVITNKKSTLQHIYSNVQIRIRVKGLIYSNAKLITTQVNISCELISRFRFIRLEIKLYSLIFRTSFFSLHMTEANKTCVLKENRWQNGKYIGM